MQKPTSLRAWLTEHVAGLATDPDRLQLFVDTGAIVCNSGATLSYEYRYTLTIVVAPFAGDLDLLIVPLLAWISVNQPILLDRRPGGDAQPFTLQTEILDSDQVDLTIEMQLSERVRVTGRDDGGYIAERITEARYEDAFADVHSLLRRLYLGTDVIAETLDPEWLAANPLNG